MSKHVSIFLIDDDLDLLEILKDALLTLCNAKMVITASSLAEIQMKTDAVSKCSLAILDVNLGTNQPTGVDVAQWLRKIGFQGQIVFLTGHAKSDPKVIAAIEIPDTQVLAKPIKLDQLLSLTNNL